MKIAKKISVLVSLTLAVATIFTGCGAQTGTKGDTAKIGASLSDSAKGKSANEVSKSDLPIVKGKESLKVLVCVNDDAGAPISPKDIVLHKEIAEQTNVDINWVEVAKSAWTEKKGLVLASGDLPDVFMDIAGLFTDAEMLNMASQKTIVPLDTLSDYSPNFTALMKGDAALRPTITAEDGHIYGLPYYIQPSAPDAKLTCDTANVFYINKKWLDAVKMDIPKTTDDFKKVLQAFKTQDPNGNKKADEIPMSSLSLVNSASTMYNDWFGAFGRVASNAANAGALNIGLKDGKAVFEPAQPEFKEGIKYFADLNAAGLLDIESFTQDATVFNAKLKAPVRTVGAFKAWRGTAWRLSPEDTEYVAMPALTGPNGNHVWPRRFDGVIARTSYLITSSCKNPELAMRWGDNLLADDNTYQFWTNVKIGYNLEAVKGEPFKLIKAVDVGNAEQKKQTGFGVCGVNQNNKARKPIDPNPLNVDNEKTSTDKLYADSYPKEFYPNVFLNIEESKIINEVSAEVNNYIVKTYAEWITKGGVDKGWDAYLKQLDAMGLPKLMEQYQTALDRFNKNK